MKKIFFQWSTTQIGPIRIRGKVCHIKKPYNEIHTYEEGYP
jgi:hypothetical protein